jgi:uncharacterized protein (DUF924 family)
MQDAGAVLDFWFGPVGSERYGQTRDAWFRKDALFDAQVRAQFGPAIEAGLAGCYREWAATPRGALAQIVLLDQFTRNSFRDSPRALAGDAMALAAAEQAIARGDDLALIGVERWFVYLPYTHAESVASQQRSVELFTRLRDETGLTDPLVWAKRHASVIYLFGRFPHRNVILGRESTPEEVAFLAAPGSRF